MGTMMNPLVGREGAATGAGAGVRVDTVSVAGVTVLTERAAGASTGGLLRPATVYRFCVRTT